MHRKMIAMGLVCLLGTGCIVKLRGRGESGVGFTSSTKIFSYHEVDGDKEQKTSEAELDLKPAMDLFLDFKNSGTKDDSGSE